MEQAKAQAMRLLRYRARTERELRQRLAARGVAARIVAETISALRAVRLVDDRAFAEAWVESRLRLRPTGSAGLRWELRQKGVADELAREVIAKALTEEQERDLARQLVEKSLRGVAYCDRAVLGRVTRLLRRRGFSADAIAQAVPPYRGEDLTA